MTTAALHSARAFSDALLDITTHEDGLHDAPFERKGMKLAPERCVELERAARLWAEEQVSLYLDTR